MSDCQFCSVLSKQNGEDPIGTAIPMDVLIVVELPQPWTPERLMSEPMGQFLIGLHASQEKQGIILMPTLIAPDSDYSPPGYARVLYYQRPSSAFAQYRKQEFLVPIEQQLALIKALTVEPEYLEQFELYRQQNHPARDIMVCTHGNVDVACSRFGFPIYDQLRKNYTSEHLRVWRCSHFGGHQFAPTLLDMPTGQFWGHLEADMLDTLIYRQGEVTPLRPFYRGWAGLSKFGQIVERELWMQHGWKWLDYLRTEQVLAQDTVNDKGTSDWVELRLEFMSSDGQVRGDYDARVEVKGTVTTMHNSGGEPVEIKQYQVIPK
ncbi:MAG: sucrase ferredoxin [Leptolyngbya sp. SIO1D8]|nr:sucrase ferredoxin [Leptolyngbya sp. SIO1D8]